MTCLTRHIIQRSNSKGLPTMVNKTVDIGLSRLGCGNPVDGFQGRNDSPIINVMEGRGSHFPVFFNQSPQPQFEFPCMESHHFLLNPGEYDIRCGIKNPLFNAIPGLKNDFGSQRTGREPEAQFTDDFAGCNDLRGQSHRVGVNVLNNDNERISARQGKDFIINRTRWFIKTVPNTPIE